MISAVTNTSKTKSNEDPSLARLNTLENRKCMKNVTYISAGAGSGKTYTLTTKLANLIANNEVEPEQVILTTFTVKAANEFKEKAKAELYKIGRYDEASRLDNALMGTIDSVATNLIQKYWYAIGMSPKQGVMDDSAKESYINQSIANIPTDDDLHFFAEFRKVFTIVDRDSHPDDNFWKDHLKDIVEKSISFDITDYNQSVEESLAVLKHLCNGTTIHLDNTERTEVLNALKAEIDKCKQDAKNTIATLNGYNSLNKRYRYQSDIEFLLDFAVIIKGAPASIKNQSDNALLEDAKQKSIDLWRSQDVYDLQEKYITTIFRLAKEWNEQYTQYKLNKRIVDFSDIEHYMHKLLQDKEVAAEIGKTYTHLFVDEFQDCSPIQVKIFMALADVVKQSYWVGDTKQAIYGFRGSDTALTKAVADAIAQKEGIEGCKSETLKESWRSVPSLVDVSNRAFKEIFRPIFEDKTEEQVPLKSAMELHPEKFDIKLEDRPKNPLRYLNITEKRSARSSKLQVRDVAQYIKNVIDKEHVNPSDIAVLGRTGYSLDDVQAELTALGIESDRETTLNKESKACQLMVALTTLTVNPQDDLAKAEIAYLTQDNMGVGAIIDSKLEYNSTPKEDRTPWLSETMMISRVNAIRKRVMYQGIGALMETLVVELDVKNVMERWATPIEESMTDVKALISAAKQYEERNSELAQPATPSGFAMFLEENDVKLPVTGNGVQLLTLHGSKGLEWKYVFLLMDETLEPMDVLKHDLYGIHHFHPELPSADNLYPQMSIRLMPWIFGARNSNVADSIAQIIYASDYYANLNRHCLEESARLLYVGVTRASEVLVLVPWTAKKEFDWFKRSGLPAAGNIENGDVLGIGVSFNVVKAEYPTEEESTEEPAAKEYHCLNYHADIPSDAGSRSIAPSGVKGKSDDVSVVYRSNQYIKLNSGKLHGRSYSEVGDCIHNVYAAIESLNQAEIEQVIKAHQMGDVLPNTDDIIRAWDNLQGFLNQEFGKPAASFHERPFRRLKEDGSLVVGSIDYVYQTSEGSILIDYKTFPQVQAVTDPTDEHYAGYYAGQLDTYTDALEAAGEKVIKRYIYYPVSGLLVEVGRAIEAPKLKMFENIYCFDVRGISLDNAISEAVGGFESKIQCLEQEPDDEELANHTYVVEGKSTQGITLILLKTGMVTISVPYLASREDIAFAFDVLRAVKAQNADVIIYDGDEETVADLSDETEMEVYYYRLDNMANLIEGQNSHIGVNGFKNEFHIEPAYIKSVVNDSDPKEWTLQAYRDFADIQWNYDEYDFLSRANITSPDEEEFIARILTNNKGFAKVCEKVVIYHDKAPKIVTIEEFFEKTKGNKYIKRVDYAQFVIDKMPEKVWTKFYESFEEDPIRSPKTYLLRWNPAISSFTMDRYRNAIDEYPEGFCMDWSIYEWEEAHKGDRYYMVRVGEGNTGIVFLGQFLSEPYEGEDWAGKGKKRHYVDIECVFATDPEERPLLTIDELQAILPEIDWIKGHSGQLLTEEQAEKLDELWHNTHPIM